MQKKHYILIVLILLLLISYPIYRLIGASKEEGENTEELQTAYAEKKEMGESLLAFGVVKPAAGGEITVTSAVQGVIREVHISIGSQVEEGDNLFTLDDSSTVLKLEKAKNSLRLAEIQLEELKKGPNPQDVSIAKINVEQASSNLSFVQEKLAERETQVDKLQAELESLPEDSEEREDLIKEIEKAKEQVEATQRDVINADNQYKLAKERLAGVENKISDTDIKQAEIRVEQAKLDLIELEDQLKALEINAPSSGIVIEIKVGPGDGVSSNTNMLTILDMEKLQVEAYLDEIDVIKVEKGQEVKLIFDAYTLEEFTGRVNHISLNSRIDSGVVYYPVIIELVNKPAKLFPEMTADITVFLEKAEEVLAIPAAALRTLDGTQVVYLVLEDNELEAVAVEVGQRYGGFVEILEGIEEEARVLTGSLPSYLQNSKDRR